MRNNERHWIVTASLFTVLILAVLNFLVLIFFKESSLKELPDKFKSLANLNLLYLSSVIIIFGYGIASIALLFWKKWGFWSAILTQTGTLFLIYYIIYITRFDEQNINIEYLFIMLTVFSVGLLYGILEIKKYGVSVWERLR